MRVPSSIRPRVVIDRARHLTRRIERRIPGRAAVLAYHRVALPTIDPWSLAVSPPNFAEHLAVLRESGTIRRLEQLVAEPPSARVLSGAAQYAITFDDGYVDNLESALPLLESFDSPATVFVAPGLLGRSSYWWDVLAKIVLGTDVEASRIFCAARECGILHDDHAAERARSDHRVAHDVIYGQLILRHVDVIEADLKRLASALGIDAPAPDGRPMTVAELATLASHPLVSVGVHTMTHPRLPDLSIDDARAEIDGSARQLDEMVGSEQRVFAYPYGSSSDAVVEVARDVGFDHAMTTQTGWLSRRGDGLTAPRLHVHDVDGPTFDEWLRLWA